MAEVRRKQQRLKEIVETSQHWVVEDLLRNLDEEMDRLEHGMGHLVWGMDNRPVSMCLRPLPATPRFEVKESDDEFDLSVILPGFSKDNIRLDVERDGVEVVPTRPDEFCRPYYVKVGSKGSLDIDVAEASLADGVLSVKVKKARKKKVSVRSP